MGIKSSTPGVGVIEANQQAREEGDGGQGRDFREGSESRAYTSYEQVPPC